MLVLWSPSLTNRNFSCYMDEEDMRPGKPVIAG
jgi:hypothetical protein